MLLTGAGAGAGVGMLQMILVWGLFIAAMYFFMLKKKKKEQKRVSAMLASLEIGDVVVTTSGFYGVLIDITDEDVIVEFGSNRNCRIPMKKAAIQEVEKQN